MSKGISFRVGDMQEGGGLLGAEGPVKVRFDNCRFALASEISEDYNADEDPPAFGADLYVIGEDGEEEAEPKTQLWTAGKISRLVPSSDGETLEPAEGSTATGVTKSSNFGLFLISGCEAHKDFEEAFANGGASALNNMIAMVERKPRPEVRRKGEDAGKKTEFLAVVEVLELGGKAAKGSKGSKGTAAKPAPEKATPAKGSKGKQAPDLETLVGQAVLAVVSEEGEINKGKLTGKVTSLVESDDEYESIRGEKPAIVKLILNPSFLKGLDGVELDGATVKLG